MEKFSQGELVLVKSGYQNGGCGLIIEVDCHSSPGKDGWYSFTYLVLTSDGEVISTGESPLQKLSQASSSADNK